MLSRPLSVNQISRVRGMPVEADGVADAAGEDLDAGAVRLHPEDRGVSRVVLLFVADVAGRADRHVEHAVRSEGDELLPVVRVLRQRVVDDHRLARRLQARLDVVEADDAADLADVQRAVVEGDAVRLVEALGDGQHLVGLVVAVLVDQGIDRVAGRLVSRADEDGPLRAERHLPGVGDAAGVDLDLEARRQLDQVERQVRGRCRLRRRRGGIRRLGFLGRRGARGRRDGEAGSRTKVLRILKSYGRMGSKTNRVLFFCPYAIFSAPFGRDPRLRSMSESLLMPEAPHLDLSRRERQIVDILYTQGRATAAEVLAALPDPPSYSAVRAMLRILEDKGHVRHEQDGPRYVYLPTVGRDRAKKTALRHVLQTFFDGSAEQAIVRSARRIRYQALRSRARPAGPAHRSRAPHWSVMMTIPEVALAWLPLVDAVAKTTVILLAAAAASIVLRQASAALRHLVWTLALTSALFLPIAVVRAAQVAVAAVDASARERQSRLRRWPSRSDAAVAAPRTMAPPALGETRPDIAVSAAPAAARPRCPRAAASWLDGMSWQTMLAAVWLMGATVILARILVGLVAIRWLSRRTQEITDAAWLPMARAVAREMGITPRLRFLRGGRASMPVAAGIFRPAVIMPAAADTWTESRLRVVLLHELAHVKRRDCLTHVLGQAACAFHWFNPLAWLAVKRAADRARACLRRPGARLRHPRLGLRRSAAGDGAGAARRSLPGAARRRQPGDGAPLSARRPARRDPRSSSAALGDDSRPRSRGGGAVLRGGRAARRAAALVVHGRCGPAATAEARLAVVPQQPAPIPTPSPQPAVAHSNGSTPADRAGRAACR